MKLLGHVGINVSPCDDDATSMVPAEKRTPTQQQTKSICSDLSSLLDDLSYTSRADNNSYGISLKKFQQVLLTPNNQNQSNMDLPRGGHNAYFPLEDSFSDSFGSERASDAFADNADPFSPFAETAQQTGDSYPMSGIHYPGPNDVMFGRGGATNQHIGNIRFRQLVAEHKLDYITAAKGKKPQVAMRVVTAWRGLDPPGRFLQKTNPDLGDDSFWHDVGEKEARKKASQCLRERTADIAPILKKLGQEQVIEEEKPSMKKKVPPKRESKKLTATAQTDTQKMEAPLMKEIPITVNRAGFPIRGSSTKTQNEHKQAAKSKSSRSSKSISPPRKPAPDDPAPTRSGPRNSLVKEKKIRNIREEVSDALPSAASLVASTFDDFDSDESQESSDYLSILSADFRRLMEAPSIGNMSESIGSHASNGDQTMATAPGMSTTLENLSTSSWFRSFHSFESSSRTLHTNGSNRTMISATASSLRGIAEEQSGDIAEESIDALDLAFPVHEEFEARTANLEKLTWACDENSNYSLMSDLTGDSSNHRRRVLTKKRIDSGVSMTSNLTNLSDTSDSLKSMDLAL